MRVFLLVLLLFFIGCGGSKYFYWDVNLSANAGRDVSVKLEFPDYMKSGFVAGKRGDEFIFLNKEIPESVEKFYGGYLIKSLRSYKVNAKIYPWEYEIKPKKVYSIKIYDYYVDLKNQKAVLKAECCNRDFIIEKRYKNDFMRAYKRVFDKFIEKIGGLL